MELDRQKLNELREAGRKNLFFFARAILGFEDLDKAIHRPICELLSNYVTNTRIIVVFPRTWFKSTTASIAYPIWRAINDPNVRILIVQNIYDNACKKLRAIASIFEKNSLFRALYPEILPDSGCRWSGECLEVRRTKAHPEGTFEAAGVGTSTTSRHYDVIVEDDTVSPKKDDMTGIIQQPTQLDIEKAIGWHGLCHPMLLHPKQSQIVIVGTRWAERDLIGYVMENFPEYSITTRTACEKNGVPCTLDEGGKPTWSRFDEETLRELERTEGPYMFACLYLNKPTAAINQVFKRNWIRYFDKLPRDCFTCTSVDLAAAENEETSDPDYNVILTTAIEPKTGRKFVLEYTRDRMSPSDVIDVILRHYRKYHSTKVIVEAIGYQRTLIHWLQQKQRQEKCMFFVDQIKSHRQAKVERVRALQPFFANGEIFLKSWMSQLEQELLAFPKGAHDDIIDSLSMQIGFWSEMMDYTKLIEDEKPVSPFSADSVLDELMGRFANANMHPFDGGNMDDFYLGQIASPSLRDRVREFIYDERAESLLT